ncbi:MAG TPA: hypothetical protein V6D25_24845 [Leptolyngbyaceae cyanobacterium]
MNKYKEVLRIVGWVEEGKPTFARLFGVQILKRSLYQNGSDKVTELL